MNGQRRSTLQFPPDGVLRVLGVHDPLSALVASGGGFDALWVSSFGVSAACFGIPDSGLISAAEMLETVRRIRLASALPLIIDADTGYGGILNVRRFVREAELVGAAAICIEDAEFPKRNSFLENRGRRLATIETMCARLRAACQSRSDGAGPLILARTEAMVQGYGVEEALARATAYVAAGATAVVAHSTNTAGTDVLEFAARWERRRPLVVIPTAYPSVTLQQLSDAGASAVVLANQLLRSAYRAMQEVRRALAEAAAPVEVDAQLCSMTDIHSAVGAQRELSFEAEVERAVAAAARTHLRPGATSRVLA